MSARPLRTPTEPRPRWPKMRAASFSPPDFLILCYFARSRDLADRPLMGRRRLRCGAAAHQWQRLVAEHAFDDDLAGLILVEARPRDEIAAIGEDRVGVLHELEPLVLILAVEPHARTDDLEQVDDPERPVALVRAELAVIGMIDRHERVDLRVASGFELR